MIWIIFLLVVLVALGVIAIVFLDRISTHIVANYKATATIASLLQNHLGDPWDGDLVQVRLKLATLLENINRGRIPSLRTDDYVVTQSDRERLRRTMKSQDLEDRFG